MNNFCGMGRMVRDPELKQSDSGTNICKFTIAINRDFKNQNGEYEADFINCTSFGKSAEFINKYFSKGSMIGITGRLQIRKWEKDGENRYAAEIVVNSTSFAGEKKNSGANQVETNQVEEVKTEAVSAIDEDDLPF